MQHLVVDDHHLGVHVDRLAGLRERVIDAQPRVAVEMLQRRVEPGARGIHRHRLQPALRPERIDQHDLGPVGLLQPVGDRLGDAARGEVLALGVDVLPGTGDQRQIRRLDFVHRRAAIVSLGPRPADRHRDVAELRLDPLGPAVGAAFDRFERMAARCLPALARQLAQRLRHRPFQDRGRVVPGCVGAAIGPDAARVAVAMLGRIPAVAGHVDAAAEGQAIVDHDDLVMVRGAQRRGAVESRVDARMGHPAHQREDGGAAEQRAQRADVPAQQEDLEVGIALYQPKHEIAQGVGLARQPLFGQFDARVEVPADQHDAPPRLQHRLAAGLEVIARIDDQPRPRRRLPPPVEIYGLRIFIVSHGPIVAHLAVVLVTTSPLSASVARCPEPEAMTSGGMATTGLREKFQQRYFGDDRQARRFCQNLFDRRRRCCTQAAALRAARRSASVHRLEPRLRRLCGRSGARPGDHDGRGRELVRPGGAGGQFPAAGGVFGGVPVDGRAVAPVHVLDDVRTPPHPVEGAAR